MMNFVFGEELCFMMHCDSIHLDVKIEVSRMNPADREWSWIALLCDCIVFIQSIQSNFMCGKSFLMHDVVTVTKSAMGDCFGIMGSVLLCI